MRQYLAPSRQHPEKTGQGAALRNVLSTDGAMSGYRNPISWGR